MPKGTCGTCQHGASINEDGVACHRYPPYITKVDETTVTSNFPLVNVSSWCSEFIKKARPVGYYKANFKGRR